MTETNTPSAAITLEVPAPYTELSALETVHLDTGSSTYRLDGPRLTGTITIQPEAWPATPIPERITLLLGDRDCATGQTTDQPVINGIRLTGSCTLHPDAADDLLCVLHPYRPTPGITGLRAPERGSAHLVTVAQAVLRRWASHPRRADLLLASARHSAMQRLDQLQRDRLAPLRAQLGQTATELAIAEALALQLTALAAGSARDRRTR